MSVGSCEPLIEDVAQKLEEAVLSTMNPLVDNHNRAQAYQMLEQVKHQLNVSVPCGFLLSVPRRPALARHYGFHLLETAIKYHWETMSNEDKHFIKENTMKLMASGTKDISEEEAYIKDKVSRLVVELAKRMWPQLWSSLLLELREVTAGGPVQTQMVMLVLNRLSEDVATLQTLECPKRRRDLFQALTANMADLFSWMLALLEQHYTAYTAATSGGTSSEEVATQHVRVMQSVLECLSSYVEWVAVGHIFADSGKLLQSLCFLLEQPRLQHSAALCLLGILSRKGPLPDRLPLLNLLHPSCMDPVYRAASAAVSDTNTEGLDARYAFIKILAQVVAQLGLQLCALWGKEAVVKEPDSLQQYVFVLRAFGTHPSLSVYASVNSAWGALLRHHEAAAAVKEALPLWLTGVMDRMAHHGYPTLRDCLSSFYSRLDFDDSDEEYSEFFHKTRAELGSSFRMAAILVPVLVWEELEKRCKVVLVLPTPTLQPDQTVDEKALVRSDAYKQWEAFSTLLDWAMKAVPYHQRCDIIHPERGVNMMGQLVQYHTEQPRILSLAFSCISSLFPFIVHRPEVLETVFVNILQPLVTYSNCPNPSVMNTKPMTELRKHSACLLNKLAKNYPDIMLKGFEAFVGIVKTLSTSPNPPTLMQRLMLQDAVLALNNIKHNCQEQTAYIRALVQPVFDLLTELKDIVNSPLAFMCFLGLDKEPPEPGSPQGVIIRNNRMKLTYAFRLLETVMKRSEPPSDPKLQLSGGFLYEVPASESCTGVVRLAVRNPCVSIISEVVQPLMALVRCCNGLWLPECQAALTPFYTAAHALPSYEKEAILGMRVNRSLHVPPSATGGCNAQQLQQEDTEKKSLLPRTQIFLHLLHESWCCCLSELCQPRRCVDEYHDATRDLSTLLQCTLQGPLCNLQHLPDYRLRVTLRVFCRSWLLGCSDCDRTELVQGSMAHLASFMCERLDSRWTAVASVDISEGEDMEEEQVGSKTGVQPTNGAECDEVLDALLVRLLTRDYLDLVRLLLLKTTKHKSDKRGNSGSNNNSSGAMEATNGAVYSEEPSTADDLPESQAASGAVHAAAGCGEEVTPFARQLLAEPSILGPVMATLLKAISWPDTISSTKACALLSLCVRYVSTSSSEVLSVEDCCAVLRGVVCGLHRHGQHSENLQQLLTCGTLCYTALRPRSDALAQVLSSFPGAAPTDIATLDRLVEAAPISASFKNIKQEKQKKEVFRRIVASVVGVSVSEAMKASVQLAVLPPLRSYRRKNNVTMEDKDADIGLSNLFN